MDKRIIEQFNLRAPFKLEDATVLVLAKIGSHSHGTYIPKEDPQAIDDIDYMGVIIPPIEFTLGLREWEGLNFQFEELDVVFYSFRKFVNLLMKNNPNVLGLLWMKDEFYIERHATWDTLLHYRRAFSSKLAYHSFMGYAHAQLNKMTSFDLKTQTEWDRAIELIEAAGWTKEDIINGKQREMPKWDAVIDVYKKHCDEDKVTILIGPGELAAVELNKAPETIKKIHARHFQGYMGEKRKNLVKKYGYDTKNAAHLIRLMRMCVEFLETGELRVFRDIDGDEIRDIKAGKRSIDSIREEANTLFEHAKQIKDLRCTLPETPDDELAEKLVVHTYLTAYNLMQL